MAPNSVIILAKLCIWKLTILLFCSFCFMIVLLFIITSIYIYRTHSHQEKTRFSPKCRHHLSFPGWNSAHSVTCTSETPYFAKVYPRLHLYAYAPYIRTAIVKYLAFMCDLWLYEVWFWIWLSFFSIYNLHSFSVEHIQVEDHIKHEPGDIDVLNLLRCNLPM